MLRYHSFVLSAACAPLHICGRVACLDDRFCSESGVYEFVLLCRCVFAGYMCRINYLGPSLSSGTLRLLCQLLRRRAYLRGRRLELNR